MASSSLQTFIQDRLQAVIPTLDLSPGSQVDVGFVQPLLTYLGTDPFETDILTFLTDRFAQEFPDIYNGDPSVVSDMFVKPLIVMLTPFKRETLSVKRNQSLLDPTVLSDDDADALVANFFETRNSGGFSVGVGRVFFPNPANVQVQITTRFFTGAGLNFFPTNPTSITAEEMVFNRDGALFFMDVPLKAEKEGAEYNIDVGPDGLTGVVGIFGPSKVTNPRKFTNGTSGIDTPTFVAQAQQSLTERSLVTRRGATARLDDVFQGQIAAIQVIGAKDAEMQRDILVATSPGHAWLTGQVTLYQKLALVQCRTVDDPSISTVPIPGDTLYVYLDKYVLGGFYAALSQNLRFVRLTVEEVFAGPLQESTSPYQVCYVVRWSGSFPIGVSIPTALVLNGGFAKKGTIQISSLPSIGQVSLSVNNQEIHVYGHSDIYVRPILQPLSTAVLSNIVDDIGTKYFGVELSTLQTTSGSNQVTDSTINFTQVGVGVGDILTIEVGNDAGTYVIGAVSGTSLFLRANLTTIATNIRYTISKAAHINIFEPKIPKLPFGSVPNNDLQTVIGSNTFNFNAPATDLINYGAKVGDTIRVLSGVDAGDFTITGFVTGGKIVTVDRAAGGSTSNLTYQVFTKLTPVELPLVRLKELTLLDSSQQSTGIDVPYAPPVAVVPTCDFTSAQVRGFSQRPSGYVLPQLVDADGTTDPFVNGTSVAAGSGDRRYSLGFDPTNGGVYKAMLFANATQGEFLFPADAFTTCSYFLATSEDSSLTTNFPPVAPNPGDALTLKSGPNAGSYLIQSVYKFAHKTSGGNTVWSYFIKIYGTFPVDPIRQIIEFCDNNSATITKITNTSGTIAFPDFFVDTLNNLGAHVSTALTSVGATPPTTPIIQASILNEVAVTYEWGDPSRGVLRSYFNQPTLFQQHTGLHNNPTLYSFKTDTGDFVKFRPDPNRYQKQEIVPPRLVEDSSPLTYPRDLTPASSTANFTDSTRSTLFNLGVMPGDVLSIHEEVFFHGSTGAYGVDRETAVSSVAGSTTIQAPTTSSGAIFTQSMIGDLLFIDEGADIGAYTVIGAPDAQTLQLNKPLSRTTPNIIQQGSGASWGLDSGNDKIHTPSPAGFSGALINQWVTIYGIDSRYQGSYLISAVPDASTLVLSRAGAIGHFPAYAVDATARWIIHTAPASVPAFNAANKGTELVGLQPIRLYAEVSVDYPITGVTQSPVTSQATVTGTLKGGISEPFRIYRSNLRRVTPSEMNANQDGALFFFDTEVVSLTCETAANVSEDGYLTLDDGTAELFGYQHIVDDYTLTYSMKESGIITIPNRILPIGSADSEDNFLLISGAPLQVTYERADIVEQFQTFLDSPEDRVTAANMLARHFLPSYVSFDAKYSGGAAPSVIAKDIISYINTLTIETPLEVSKLEKRIDDEGGDPETPLKVVINLHDWDRKQWAEFSEGKIGGTTTLVPYNGSPRVSFFVPGPDVSGQTTLPPGERINLIQE